MALAFIQNKKPGAAIGKSHEHSYTTVVTPPTCTEGGYTTHTCETIINNARSTRQTNNGVMVLTNASKIPHSFQVKLSSDTIRDFSGISVKTGITNNPADLINEYFAEADGTVNGIKSLYPRTCLRTEAKGVTITVTYFTNTFTESECGHSYVDNYVDALGHDFGEWQSDENGHWKECSRCGEIESYPHIPGPEATEESPQVCTVCGYEIAPIIPHIHIYSDWTIDKAATCTTEGSQSRTCRCGDTETMEIEALGHLMTSTVITPPTCTKVGTKYYWCQRNCGHGFTTDIPKTAHQWQGDSRYGYNCIVCGIRK